MELVKAKSPFTGPFSKLLVFSIPLFVVVLFGWCAGSLLAKADSYKPSDWDASRFTYLPSGKFLKPITLHHNEALASLLWVEGVLYYAESYLDRTDRQWLGQLLKVVTELNPRFENAYEFSGTVLTDDRSEMKQALTILERGIKEFPGNWKYPLYAAMIQLDLDSNYLASAAYLKNITDNPTAPEYARTMATTFLFQGGQHQVALSMMLDRVLTSPDPVTRSMVADKMLRLRQKDLEKKGLAPVVSIHDTTLTPEHKILRKDLELILGQSIREPESKNISLRLLMDVLSHKPSPQAKRILASLRRFSNQNN